MLNNFNIQIMLPLEIWKTILIKLNDCGVVKISLINKQFHKMISENSFWKLKNKNYECAKFNIYKSINEFMYICKKIKKKKRFELHSGNTINTTKINDSDENFFQNCEGKIHENYDYCIVYKKQARNICTGSLTMLYNKYTKMSFRVSLATCDCCGDDYDTNGNYYYFSHVVYGNYIWCSTTWNEKKNRIGGKLYVFNILTKQQYIIKNIKNHYYFWKNNNSLYLCEHIDDN
jgi:hypothetical protein